MNATTTATTSTAAIATALRATFTAPAPAPHSPSARRRLRTYRRKRRSPSQHQRSLNQARGGTVAKPMAREDSLRPAPGVQVPLTEIVLRVSRSSGPGGQHANVTESRVEASFDVATSASLSDAQKRRVMARCGPVVRATAQDARSQGRNRDLA